MVHRCECKYELGILDSSKTTPSFRVLYFFLEQMSVFLHFYPFVTGGSSRVLMMLDELMCRLLPEQTRERPTSYFTQYHQKWLVLFSTSFKQVLNKLPRFLQIKQSKIINHVEAFFEKHILVPHWSFLFTGTFNKPLVLWRFWAFRRGCSLGMTRNIGLYLSWFTVRQLMFTCVVFIHWFYFTDKQRYCYNLNSWLSALFCSIFELHKMTQELI